MALAMESPVSLTGNIYDPATQDGTGIQGLIAAELEHIGEVVEFTGTLLQTVDHGLLMDNAQVVVRHPKFAVPLRLSVTWNNALKKFQYRNMSLIPNSVSFDVYHEDTSRAFTIDRPGYSTDRERHELEVTQEVFSRWSDHALWKMRQKCADRNISYFQQRALDRETKEWNSRRVELYDAGFQNESEKAVFFNRFLNIAEQRGMSNMRSFTLNMATSRNGKGLSQRPLTNFTTSSVMRGAAPNAPMLAFYGRTKSGSEDIVNYYDGENIFRIFRWMPQKTACLHLL